MTFDQVPAFFLLINCKAHKPYVFSKVWIALSDDKRFSSC